VKNFESNSILNLDIVAFWSINTLKINSNTNCNRLLSHTR
jgi:hypothetical protein